MSGLVASKESVSKIKNAPKNFYSSPKISWHNYYEEELKQHKLETNIVFSLP